MRIFVKAKPSAKETMIEKTNETNFIVSVKEPPVKGKANEAIIKVLAKYFEISPSQINIISGYTSRDKIIDIKK